MKNFQRKRYLSYILRKMKIIYGLAIVLFSITLSMQATPFKTCTNGDPPKEVRVDGCTTNPCNFVRGRNITAQWDFFIKEETKFLKPRVKAIINGKMNTFPFPQKDACTSLKDTKCPLEAGKNVTYQLNMPVRKSSPKIRVTIEFSFLNDKGKVVVCFKLPSKVTDK